MFEEIGAGFFVTLLLGFIDLDNFEEAVAKGVAEEPTIFEDFVAGIVFFVHLFGFGFKEGFRGDEAIGIVKDSLFDEWFCGDLIDWKGFAVGGATGCGAGGGGDGDGLDGHGKLLGQGAECDLEAVEDETRAAWVDVVVGDIVHDLGDSGADAVAVFGDGKIVCGGAGATEFGVGDGAAGGVVEVAELFSAEAGAAALAASGEDVATAAGA